MPPFSVTANAHHGAPSHLFFTHQSKLNAAKIHLLFYQMLIL